MVSGSSFLLLSCFHKSFSGQVPILCLSRNQEICFLTQYFRIIRVLKHVKKGGIGILYKRNSVMRGFLLKAFQFS